MLCSSVQTGERRCNDEETQQNVEQPAASDNIADKAASGRSEADVLINELTTQLKIHRSGIAQLQSKLTEKWRRKLRVRVDSVLRLRQCQKMTKWWNI